MLSATIVCSKYMKIVTEKHIVRGWVYAVALFVLFQILSCKPAESTGN